MRSLSTFFLRILLGVFVLTVVASLIRTIWASHQALQSVQLEEKRVEMLEEKTRELEAEVREATSSYQLEKQAREKLYLQKNGETIIRIE